MSWTGSAATRLNRHLGYPERQRGEIEESEEVGGFAVIAGGKAAPVFELLTGAFNPGPRLGERGVRGARHPAAGSGRDDWRRPLPCNVRNKRLTLIPLVGNDVGRSEAREEGPRLRTVMALAPSHNKA